LDKLEKETPKEQVAEWERIHREESGLSLAARKTNQLAKLSQVIHALSSFFGPNLIAATKSVRGEKLSDDEANRLQQSADKTELMDRVKGLVKVFGDEYYRVLAQITGKSFLPEKQIEKPVVEAIEEETAEAASETGRVSRLPKGYNKWDLNLIKLHESKPTDGKRIWVEFWSLKGLSEVGEILYNPTKDLFYFKPYKASTPSFALTDEHGRKATSLAKSYYFRVAPDPPIIEKDQTPKAL
jgi:hypothetical protein